MSLVWRESGERHPYLVCQRVRDIDADSNAINCMAYPHEVMHRKGDKIFKAKAITGRILFTSNELILLYTQSLLKVPL